MKVSSCRRVLWWTSAEPQWKAVLSVSPPWCDVMGEGELCWTEPLHSNYQNSQHYSALVDFKSPDTENTAVWPLPTWCLSDKDSCHLSDSIRICFSQSTLSGFAPPFLDHCWCEMNTKNTSWPVWAWTRRANTTEDETGRLLEQQGEECQVTLTTEGEVKQSCFLVANLSTWYWIRSRQTHMA